MNYLKPLLQITPYAVFISVFGYGLVFLLLKIIRKRKTTPPQVVFEFFLFGWIVYFFWVTQVLSFGNNMGDPYNLEPLKPLFLAFKYGTTNAAMVNQLLMNVIMFVPFGVLLPLVFTQKNIGFSKVLAASFLLSLLTESTQFLTGRSVDIDDLIANSFGGILGIALLSIVCVVARRLNLRKCSLKGNNHHSVFISSIVFLIFISPMLLIKISESNKDFGFVYYGHPIPTEIEIPDWISDDEGQAIVYKIKAKTTLEELQNQLINLSGFECQFNLVGDQVYQCKSKEDTETIFIYKNLIWTVYYRFGLDAPSNSVYPEEDSAIYLANQYLDSFQIDSTNLLYQGKHEGYSDGYLHLIFEDKASNPDEFIWGNILLALDENNELISISDNRIFFTPHKTIQQFLPGNL